MTNSLYNLELTHLNSEVKLRIISEKTRLVSIVIALIVLIVMVLVGFQIVITMATQMPPTEFVIVNKAHVNNWWLGNQYRVYYNQDISFGYFLTTETDYNRFQIGDWFNGTIIMENNNGVY